MLLLSSLKKTYAAISLVFSLCEKSHSGHGMRAQDSVVDASDGIGQNDNAAQHIEDRCAQLMRVQREEKVKFCHIAELKAWNSWSQGHSEHATAVDDNVGEMGDEQGHGSKAEGAEEGGGGENDPEVDDLFYVGDGCNF